jgi:hypothetical protein
MRTGSNDSKLASISELCVADSLTRIKESIICERVQSIAFRLSRSLKNLKFSCHAVVLSVDFLFEEK